MNLSKGAISVTIENAYWLSTNADIMQDMFNGLSYTIDLKMNSE